MTSSEMIPKKDFPSLFGFQVFFPFRYTVLLIPSSRVETYTPCGARSGALLVLLLAVLRVLLSLCCSPCGASCGNPRRFFPLLAGSAR